ncbi:C-C motif chemokine 4-like [Phycodurus eques]|uniref:C-C motif chemokine 4-like n=1 Tax=Phycodurus eques TaxID=693459 RepID=UPI002ACD6E25|nr:C-C motif chemokine 4-like [Phycodurus eques]
MVRWQEIKRTWCSASAGLQKSLMVMATLAVVVTCGKGAGKPTECCKKVSSKKITEEVFAFRVEVPQLPCLPAIIFYTKDGYHCAQIRAPWVLEKTAAIRRAAVARALTTSSPSERSLPYSLTS